MKKKVREHEGWYKDMTTGVVDCTNNSEYEKYMKSYRADQKEKEDFEALQNDVSALKSEMGDIKSLLLTLVQNQKGL
jgi:hypothetical protein